MWANKLWQAVVGLFRDVFGRSPGRVAPEPVEAPEDAHDEELLPDSKAWISEMMREHGVAPRSRTAALDSGAGEGANPLGVGGGQDRPPLGYPEYVALLHRVYDPARQRLVEEAVKTPIFQAAFRIWTPGDSPGTRNMLNHLQHRIGLLMGHAYGFTPAPLGEVGQLNGRFWAYAHYRPAQARINLSSEIFLQPVEVVIEALIHEQIHRLQHERIQQAQAGRLGPEEQMLARCWGAKYWYVGDDVEPDYHAVDTAKAVLTALRSAFGVSQGAQMAGPMGQDRRE